ncbi:MAG TPA: hypothetical protein VE982_05560 [Gaiellaceae bacterium]|nr:hypothetical protein [Gaiellaceae bacterium]
MKSAVRVACVQAEPVIFDRDATIAKLAGPAGHYHRPDVLSLTVTPHA